MITAARSERRHGGAARCEDEVGGLAVEDEARTRAGVANDGQHVVLPDLPTRHSRPLGVLWQRTTRGSGVERRGKDTDAGRRDAALAHEAFGRRLVVHDADDRARAHERRRVADGQRRHTGT
ncbi:MAG TPA: hypothetical protein VGR62_01570 [Candidatus Binatia bacterium]|jgi:hypothetical protein|nr:hypothetical protein [Candidatus Binatia bacterium]